MQTAIKSNGLYDGVRAHDTVYFDKESLEFLHSLSPQLWFAEIKLAEPSDTDARDDNTVKPIDPNISYLGRIRHFL